MPLLRPNWVLCIGLSLVILLGFAGMAIWKASRALQRASEEVAAEENMKFTVSPLNRAVSADIGWISGPALPQGGES